MRKKFRQIRMSKRFPFPPNHSLYQKHISNFLPHKIYWANDTKEKFNKKVQLSYINTTLQKTIQNFTIDAQGFRKTKNENPPTLEMGVTS